ncbi:hypothetical protein KIN20_004232 [Parelaphostrongylus tenuis]|uniref:DNA polymerase delta subunit 3 n=1 Tax=Parelaphostrongylus tenuis TaxID=148309 RepID=A0AAD5MR17_PARTN|nr:hypothetical protein KIN20_004232 [Parelaphostrongylus tenuis]
MERVLMNMIFDENKIVTAVTLSRSQDIPIEEAFSAMKQFYEKHRNSNGLWATFNVTGSATICGVCANSTVLCRDCDLDRIKDSFSEVFAVELFSLQHCRSRGIVDCL